MDKTTSFSGEAERSRTTRGFAIPDTLKRFGIYLAAALFIFLLGLTPMWLKARGTVAQRDVARRELRLSRTQGTLASAAIDARRGEYETARQTTSDFFTALRTELDSDEDSPFSPRQREAAAPLLERRDEIITLLARREGCVRLGFTLSESTGGIQLLPEGGDLLRVFDAVAERVDEHGVTGEEGATAGAGARRAGGKQ